MITLLLASIVLQTPPAQDRPSPMTPRASIVRDSAPGRDSARHNPRRRLPVTAEVLRTAFRDPAARELFYRAKRARLRQDSMLRNYDAESRERVSIGLRIGERGHERVMFRQENVGRVRWQREGGVRLEILGSRIAQPLDPDGWKGEMQFDIANLTHVPVPYFPGQEPLSFGTAPAVREDVNDRGTVHPFAEGAEAYYTYETGDSLRYTLPDKSVVSVREIRVRPRSQEWNLVVGSLMFDIRTGQLVRAAFRSAHALDGWEAIQRSAELNGSDPNAALLAIGRGIISPLEVRVTDVTITYSLHRGRYWLPRSKSIRGVQRMAFAHLPVMREQVFTYHSVNGDMEPFAPIVETAPKALPATLTPPDSLTPQAAGRWRDSVRRTHDSLRTRFRDSLFKAPCDSTGRRVVAGMRANEALPIVTEFPCELEKLVNSPEFVGSIFDENEDVFGDADRAELIGRTLSLLQQAPLLEGMHLPRPVYGASMTRYNRIEGFSTGIGIEQTLGGGMVAKVNGRIGFADWEPGGEATVARTNLSRTIGVAGYHRLVSASDWGSPLSFGAGMSALLFGRDEGFYYRATGAELTYARANAGRSTLDVRLFGERQRTAVPEASFSVSGTFIPNIVAAEGWRTGASARYTRSFGRDPRGFRVFNDLRLESALGDSRYGRGALDVTFSRGLAGGLTSALTLAGGTTTGAVPTQRLWYLGGTHTVRGQRLDPARAGNAFWLGRAELGRDFAWFRPTVFGDIGWAGDRRRIGEIGRPLSGAGIGFSIIDGMLRLDVARGINPEKRTRLDLYLGARF